MTETGGGEKSVELCSTEKQKKLQKLQKQAVPHETNVKPEDDTNLRISLITDQ